MLKITCQHEPPYATVKVEGKMRSPWLNEVRSACATARAVGAPVRLDLASVSFADDAAVELIRELRDAGIRVERCSTYLAALLQLEAQ